MNTELIILVHGCNTLTLFVDRFDVKLESMPVC